MDIRSFFSPKTGAKPKTSSADKRETTAKGKEEEKAKKSKQKSKKLSPDDEEEVLPKKKRSQKKKQIDSDSDEDPLPAKIRKSKSSSSSTKRTVIPESDEEEVIEIPKPKSTDKPKQAKKDDTKTKRKEEEKKIITPPKPKLKPTTADAFFGSSNKIQRVERSAPLKRKKSDDNDEPDAPKRKTEKRDIIDVLDDDNELEKSIQEIEQSEPTKIKKEDARKDAKKKSPEKKPNGHAALVTKHPAQISPQKKRVEAAKSPEKITKSPDKTSKSPAKTAQPPAKPSMPVETSKSPIKAVQSPAKPSTPIRPVKEKQSKPAAGPSPKKEAKKEEGTPSLEKKKSGYMAFKMRDGPRALGSKEIPEGADNCMEGLTFVITGVLDAIDRDEAATLIQRYGGKVTTSVSGRTSYLIVGREPGESKIDKAKKHKTKQIDEDGLLDLIRTLPGKKSKYEQVEEKETSKKKVTAVKPTVKSPSSTMESESRYFKKETSAKTCELSHSSQGSQQSQTFSQPSSQSAETDPAGLLWVDKHRPTRMKDIVGQGGDKSNANKLLKWLINWHDNHGDGKGKKPKGGFFAAKEDGSLFKAALLSGPPGVGKTTTATLTCQTADFSFIEMNASDARNKKILEQVVSESLNNTTMDGLLNVGGKVNTRNHALIMDEVDGMAGNEDRGGVQVAFKCLQDLLWIPLKLPLELIALIKKSKIPIICMCNDRNHPKIRSLANHCFDLRFYKPRVEQIKAFAMKVAFREGLKISPPAMEQIIIGANQDIRQVVHNLQMWTSKEKSMTFDQAKSEAKTAGKNIKLGPFDVTKKLFTGGAEADKMTIHDKTDLFFNDYSFVPLFVQENYLLSQPWEARGNVRKILERTSTAADSIADSNLVESRIRGSQNWSLLPLQGFFSCVIPPDMMRGGLGTDDSISTVAWKELIPREARPNFTRAQNAYEANNKNKLGKFEVRNCVITEFKSNASSFLKEFIECVLGDQGEILSQSNRRILCTLANKSDLNMDYLPFLRRSLVSPLANAGDDTKESVQQVIDLMDSYDLRREDWDSIMEISKWEGMHDETSSISSKVKAAFTRAYNKEAHLVPYAAHGATKKGRGARGVASSESQFNEEESIMEEEEEGSDDDVTNDAMIKKKTKKAAAKGRESSSGTGRGKGKGSADGDSGKGKGKGKGRGKNSKS